MKTFKEFIRAKDNFVEHNGVRVISNSFINNMVVVYDEIDRTDRTDGKGRYRKNTPTEYEVDQFKEYGVDIEGLYKKSDYPFSFNFKTKEKIKVKDLVQLDGDEGLFSQKGMPRNFVYIHFYNDNMSFLIHKEDVEKFSELETKDQNAFFKIVGY